MPSNMMKRRIQLFSSCPGLTGASRESNDFSRWIAGFGHECPVGHIVLRLGENFMRDSIFVVFFQKSGFYRCHPAA